MWCDSEKWKSRRAAGAHGVVRFDVFCGHCKKQLAEDIDEENINRACLTTDRPMETFCGVACMVEYQRASGVKLLRYGWSAVLSADGCA